MLQGIIVHLEFVVFHEQLKSMEQSPSFSNSVQSQYDPINYAYIEIA